MFTRMRNAISYASLEGKHIERIFAAVFIAYVIVAWTNPKDLITFDKVRAWYKTKKTSKFRGKNYTSSSTNNECLRINNELRELSPKENEYRIIVLGDTGSGKSSLGNDLLNADAFKTSYYANAETKTSSLKSTLRTLKNCSKTYKIDIIDTPGTSLETGLSKKELQKEIQKAIILSAPGPHAFIMCIQAASMKNDYTDALKPYQQYFVDDLNDFTIVAFTSYDQFESEANKVNSTTTTFQNQKSIYIGKESEHEKNNKLEQIINIINERDMGIVNMFKSKRKQFVHCELSKHAEEKLQDILTRIWKHKLVIGVSRESIKMSPVFLTHFSQKCHVCQTFNED